MFEFSQEPFKEALDRNKQAKASTATLNLLLGKFPWASLLLGLSPNSSLWAPRHGLPLPSALRAGRFFRSLTQHLDYLAHVAPGQFRVLVP